MNISISPTKCRALYQALTLMQKQGTLNSLADAEQMLSSFGAKVEEKNTIKFDFVMFGKTYEERLFEYTIPLHNGASTTFYVDKNLGFECGSKLPLSYKQVIKGLHLEQANTAPSHVTLH
jgi:hypothetical protein